MAEPRPEDILRSPFGLSTFAPELPGDCGSPRPRFTIQRHSVLYIPTPDGYFPGMDGMVYDPCGIDVPTTSPGQDDSGDTDAIGCGAPDCDDGYTDDGTCEACHGLGEDYRHRYSLLDPPDDNDDP